MTGARAKPPISNSVVYFRLSAPIVTWPFASGTIQKAEECKTNLREWPQRDGGYSTVWLPERLCCAVSDRGLGLIIKSRRPRITSGPGVLRHEHSSLYQVVRLALAFGDLNSTWLALVFCSSHPRSFS